MTKPAYFKSISVEYENLPHQRKLIAQSKDKIISFLLSRVYLTDRIFSEFLFFSRDAYEHEIEKIIEHSSRKISVITVDAAIDNNNNDTFSVEILISAARHISKRASEQNYLRLFFKMYERNLFIDKKSVSFSGGDGEFYCLEHEKNNKERMSIHETITHKKMCLSFIDAILNEVDKGEFKTLITDMISKIKGVGL